MSLLFSLALASLPALPEPVANNAVAKVIVNEQAYFLSFMGLGANKDHRSVHNKVWALKLGDKQWQEKSPVPSSLQPKGRLASTAVGLGEYAYVFGGYTVNSDHTEISSPDVYRYDLKNDRYTQLANMPVPVDDSVALSYQQRYIYLVSGWHNDGNVNLVQVYDIQTDTWQQASPFLGEPVFGQAAAISGNTIVICDGVKTQANADKRRSFAAVAQCLKGTINESNPLKIDWRTLPHPTGTAHYRMAASSYNGAIYMLGGSANPYNYNGMGYNGKPAPASSHVWRFDIANNRWKIHSSLKTPSMDHRGLLEHGGILYRIGGMDNQQQVTTKVLGDKVEEL
ncbi:MULTISPECIES: kelch repeat-containing protein [unclassified Pseudoalteromonas]|uniref:Kelch repeat-containing protein n=1 Tax=unclassified Pseudoalteromonas TaxID=194690 RepID=UPI0025B3EDDE|nr:MULTISPECIES: kelch repeat-containing protein [unclassified Pseudoalteromonas]MDN3380469.1 kelch repeat-containing protein [Pseudoalteromonas sp. APC 3893]MDN3388851.1 kelch repeat-containing protein [Pseudoalteromonas sp. APC 4017]